ncbi:camp-dependent protein kinase catalytic subunit [Phlyctochytrium planicorne]|nr:camp-dependent protein kinase catalytic subunit [Phlyctochytrium planicorne]
MAGSPNASASPRMPPKASNISNSGVVPLPDIQGRDSQQLSSSLASLNFNGSSNPNANGSNLSRSASTKGSLKSSPRPPSSPQPAASILSGSTHRLPDIKRVEKDQKLSNSKGSLSPTKQQSTPRASSPSSRKVSLKHAANNLVDSASKPSGMDSYSQFNSANHGTTSTDGHYMTDSSPSLPKGGPQVRADDQGYGHQQQLSNNNSAYTSSNTTNGLMPAPTIPMTSRPSIAALVESSLAAVSSVVGKDRQNFTLNDFTILNTLGTGSFGRVHLVQLKATGKHFAMKVLRKADVVRLRQVEHTINEKHILERLDFPFLVGLLGAFQDSANLYLVLEYVQGGELFSYLRKSGRFPNHIAKFYAAEVVMAFEYLHSKDIIYRDLKPENLLIDAKGHIKITDFGFAKVVPDVTWTLCGTPDYLAPEIIQSKGYGKAVDWWALGILIYEMIAGHPPFFDDDHFKLYEKILACKLRFPPHFDPLAKDLVKRLLTPDLSKRYGNLKAGAEDIKRHKWFSDIDWVKLVSLELPSPYMPRIGHEGDTSNFDRYDENHEPYGVPIHDPYKDKFKDF